MAERTPDVSIVVPTYRRPASLGRALAGLVRQQAPFAWDVVVVDNDPGRSAYDVVETMSARDASIRYVAESRVGVAHARNTGLAASRGPTVAFLDDDVVPQPGWLARVCAPVLAGSATAAGGPVLLDPAVVRPAWFDEAGLGGYLSAFSLGDAPRELRDGEIVLTANVAVTRASLVAAGGFDPTYGPRGATQLVADDAHLVRELRRGGGRVVYVPEAVVVHELSAQRLRRRYLLRRAYLQGRSDWMLERTGHVSRRFGGARVALTYATSWLRAETAARRREGLGDPAVRFHLGCDLVRYCGALREAGRLSR